MSTTAATSTLEKTEAIDLPTAAIALVRGIEHLRAEIAATEHVGTTELRALARIIEAHTVTPKQLANSLGLTTGTVTALTDRLVESGLLTRTAHPTDRRSLILELTPAGENVMQRISVNFRAAIMGATEGANDQQIAEMARFLQNTAARMNEVVLRDGALAD